MAYELKDKNVTTERCSLKDKYEIYQNLDMYQMCVKNHSEWK